MKKRRFISLMAAFVMVFTMVSASAGTVYGASVTEMTALSQNLEFGKQYSASWTDENSSKVYYGKVIVPSSGIIGISATKPSDDEGNHKLTLSLYDGSGEAVWGSECTYTVDNDGDYRFNIGVIPGTYFLALKAGSKVTSGEVTTEYTVNFTENLYAEREPNTNYADATVIDLGKTYTGYFGSDGAYKADECDMYQFDCIKGQSYRISVGNYNEIKDTSTMIDLTDAGGYERIISMELADRGYCSFTANASGTHYIKFSNCNDAQYEYTVRVDQTNPAALTNAIRICGNDRYDTAIAIAKQLKKEKQIRKFDCVVVASGLNYPDALSGGYLAKEKDAPMLLVGTDVASENKAEAYIKANLKQGGIVYILGGTGVVTQRFRDTLTGFNVYRLYGSDRYATNLSILNKLDCVGQDLLICTGDGYADSLSASAVGLPILLVSGSGLKPEQRAYVETLNPENIYIIGGDGVVSNALMNSLKAQGEWNVERVAGVNRYLTSVEVAKKFFPEGSATIAMAYAMNYPDGLSGGPLAMELGAPLVLTDSVNYSYADNYATSAGAKYGVVYGGPAIVSDNAVKNILN